LGQPISNRYDHLGYGGSLRICTLKQASRPDNHLPPGAKFLSSSIWSPGDFEFCLPDLSDAYGRLGVSKM
jgi:hypothetical protein